MLHITLESFPVTFREIASVEPASVLDSIVDAHNADNKLNLDVINRDRAINKTNRNQKD